MSASKREWERHQEIAENPPTYSDCSECRNCEEKLSLAIRALTYISYQAQMGRDREHSDKFDFERIINYANATATDLKERQ